VRGAGPLEERRDVGGGRRPLEIAHRPSLFHPALLHHHNLVGEARRFGQVVGYEQGREVKFGSDTLECLVRFAPRDRIERTERLVEEDNFLLRGECAGDRGTLSLSARQLAREAIAEPDGIEAHTAERFVRDRLW
jgi:hypothetical protein